MTVVTTSKDEHIEFFRANGFNPFPMKSKTKEADNRYDASRTKKNQPIEENENYGITPLPDSGTLILDFDDKERFREFAEETAKKYMVSETGKGWHIPLKNVTGHIRKGRLFDFKISSDKPKIEIQSSDQYVVGIGSTIYHDKLEEMITYTNVGTMEIQDANGTDIHQLIDDLEQRFNVATQKELGTGSTQYLRDNFKKGIPPSEGQSNNYFHQSPRVCLTENKTIEEAEKVIREIYDKWNPRTPKRAWSNVLYKIKEVYDNPDKFIISKGRPKGNSSEIDRTQIALEILQERKLYSDKESHEIFENKDGFLEPINHTLKSDLFSRFPQLTKADNDDILFKLESGAEDIPKTNLDLIVFNNGTFDNRIGTTIETNELADMGFREYGYLEKTKENEPTEYMKILYSDTPYDHHKRINAGLKAIFRNRVDSRISIIYGESGVGKSTPLNILCELLGEQYAVNVNLEDFLADRATKSMVNGKRLLNINDIPETWKDFTAIKTITGERSLNIREFNKKGKVTANKLKIWASGNYLPEIKPSEKDPMYSRRLSLVHNIGKQKIDDSSFPEKIIKEEGEKIISWILNLADKECEYEDKITVKQEWEGIASPEVGYLVTNYDNTAYENRITVMEIIKDCLLFSGHKVDIVKMIKSLKSLGYVIKDNTVTNIIKKETS